MRRIGKIPFRWILLASVILGICGVVPAYVRMPEQCVLCRAERVEYRIVGIPFSKGLRQDGEFTSWYVTNRPPHKHIWRYSAPGCMMERNCFGMILSFTMVMRHPVLFLKPSEELKFVKQQDEAALTKFFADMASPDVEVCFRAFEAARTQLSNTK